MYTTPLLSLQGSTPIVLRLMMPDARWACLLVRLPTSCQQPYKLNSLNLNSLHLNALMSTQLNSPHLTIPSRKCTHYYMCRHQTTCFNTTNDAKPRRLANSDQYQKPGPISICQLKMKTHPAEVESTPLDEEARVPTNHHPLQI